MSYKKCNIWPKVTENQNHNFLDQKPILDFRRGEQIQLPHVK